MTTDVITLRGKEIAITVATVRQDALKFYAENPRIYSLLWKDGDETQPTQHEIFEVLSKTDHVRETLVPSIRANGGLIEPLLVKGGVVLEGNSRLAAYRVLAQSEKEKWAKVRARILPDTVDEDDVFALLGEYHLVGKKDWQPFEQAGYLYRRHKNYGATPEELKAQIGLSESKIVHLISVYQFMLDNEDRNPSRWSYYDELLKGRKFNKAISLFPNFRDLIVEKIKSGEIERAVDIRDRLPLITKAGGNTLKKFVNGGTSFEEAVSDARLRGAGDYNVRKLQEFRNWFSEAELDLEFRMSTPDQKKVLRFELDKIERRLGNLKKYVTKNS